MTKQVVLTEQDQFGLKQFSVGKNWCAIFEDWSIRPTCSDKRTALSVFVVSVTHAVSRTSDADESKTGALPVNSTE